MTEGTNVDHPFRSEQGRRAACRSLAAATAEKLTSPVHATIFGAGLSPRRWVVLEVAVLAAITMVLGEVTTRVAAAYAAGCGTVAAALAIALLRHAPKSAASAVAREVRACWCGGPAAAGPPPWT